VAAGGAALCARRLLAARRRVVLVEVIHAASIRNGPAPAAAGGQAVAPFHISRTALHCPLSSATETARIIEDKVTAKEGNMIRFVRKRLTYANIIASLALLFAMSGGAYAATHYLINSTKQINPRVIRALQGKAGVGTPGSSGPQGPQGPQGKEGPQGKQGPAGVGTEGKEGAPGKEGKTGAQGPEGPAGPLSVKTWRVTANENENPILATVGQYTVVGHCTKPGVNTIASTFVRSGDEKTYLQTFFVGPEDQVRDGKKVMTANVEYQVNEHNAESNSSEHAFWGPNDGGWAVQSPSLALNGFANQGVWLNGKPCSFSGYVVIEP
jgi:hypothetical protein